MPARDVEGLPEGPPSFAVVTNHLDTNLGMVLEEAKEEELLSYTLFGVESRSVPVNAELLARFDAVVTIGRTVVLAAAMDKPVYVADIHGSDGWLHPRNYSSSQRHSFSGRARGLKDQRAMREELLDRRSWPGVRELARLRELVSEDHALSRRVEELERFFGLVIGAHRPDSAAATDGRLGVIDFADMLTNKAHLLNLRLELITQNQEKLRLLEVRNENDLKELDETKASRVWKMVRKFDAVREKAKAVMQRKR